DQAPRLRGRRGRDRRLAEAFEAAGRRTPRTPAGRADDAKGPRRRPPELAPLLELLARTGQLEALARRLGRPRDDGAAGKVGTALRHVTYASMPHGAKSYLAAALASAAGERLVWIARDAEIADRVVEELQAWLGDPAAVVTLEPRTALAYERSVLVRDETAARVAALAAWRSGAPHVLVASVQALFQRTLPPEALPDDPLRLHVGARLRQERLLAELIALGYEAVPEVGGRGEFARRGGLVDLFPPGQPLPVRAEWFGDELASLRAFDPTDQRGVGPLLEAAVLPAGEFLLPELDREPWLRQRLGRLGRRLPLRLAADLERLASSGDPGDAAEVWGGILAPATGLDHLGEAIWVVDEPDDVAAAAQGLWAQADERAADLEAAGELPRGWPPAYLPPRGWRSALAAARTLELHWESEVEGAPPGGNPFGWHEPALPPAPLGHLGETIARWRGEGERVVVTSDQSARLAELFDEAGMVAAPVARVLEAPAAGALVLVERSLNGGFAGGPDGLVLLTDRELFGTVRVRRPRALRRVVPRDLLERLQPGDAVVHIDHGVARYAGLVRRPAGGPGDEERDFLELHYAGRDRMWVPVEQIDRVSRYAGDEQPPLSRLGGGEWLRTKARVRRAVTDIARELLELYSARARARGHAFGEDSPWQQELEAGFPYEETPDQLRATAEVKADMETERPMDRLVVGDVGYGKTEVALRAAFKATQDGRQVAVLVPTTVLAQQHLETFRARFAAYPIVVRMLSRFVAPAAQAATVAGLAEGSVDLVIGTHRLLSQDIRFRDLGLLVVDEEQRFGVAHKERLKRMKTEVDVLTLSATPIPRTLNMALIGVRDMSVIETPPEDRLPIQTRVAEASAGLVRDAILRELDRGGQVFFVHNRVETIEAQAEQLRRLLPDARIVVGHGQMPEGMLERVMLTFARGEYDVLVCTTIIESGLDIPNANTIVIDRADTLGLAQLYQLRGRVGRSSRRAYAYLLYRRRGQLSEVARKRLQAIFNASELGAGFQIALSDLEIRGAGTLRGAEQHGNIAAVGFDLYTQLLAEAVEEQKAFREGRPPTPAKPGAVIDLPVDAYLPDEYVPEEMQKLELYRRLSQATAETSVAAVRADLLDRFGPLPAPVERLLEVAALRLAAEAAGITSVAREEGQLVVRFGADWSRVATARAMAPTHPADPIRAAAGGVTYASNQMRVRLPRDPAAAWRLTRAIVERLAEGLLDQRPAAS
ncbi:MAG: transcription-repair coupling factor, partial [Candidatus Limnocylindrales bacterium]